MLEIPFELRSFAQAEGARWDPDVKAYLFTGAELPEALKPWRPQPYSWERFREDDLNGVEPTPSVPLKDIVLRPHQKEAAAAVMAAVRHGFSGFLVADDVGLGKTIETWAAVLEMEDVETVLITCPLAVIAHWRRTIQWMGDGGKRVVVINYDRLKKLFDVPANIVARVSSRRRKKVRKVRTAKGVARYGEAWPFDLAVWDESHKLRNPASARSSLAMRLNAGADFVLWLSATAGQNPLELGYLAPILAEVTGAKASDLRDFEAWCMAQDIGVKRGAYGKWIWRGDSDDPEERAASEQDLLRMHEMLFGGKVPVGIRRSPTDIEGWPEINRILLPVALEGEDRVLYEKAWGDFRRALELERQERAKRAPGAPRKDSPNGLVARMRFRQKSSLLRTAATVDLAIELLEQGQQVAVSVAFLETLEVVRDALSKAGYGVAEVHGRMSGPEKERQRLDFQHGRKTVCVYTVEEGISLHEGEYNDARRSNIIHDLRWSAIQMKQIEGRTHRDGRFSQVYWMLGEGTVEEGLAEVVAGRLRSMSVMQGDMATVEEIEKLLETLCKR